MFCWYSICPKGWQLPLDSGTKSWSAITSLYVGSSLKTDNAEKAPLYLVRGGFFIRSNGSLSNQGSDMDYWSATASSSTNAYTLNANSDAILSDIDYESVESVVKDDENGAGLESLIGYQFSTQDDVRLVPDILQNGDDFFFPVFTSDTEMGEYGEQFSKIEKHFLETIILARNNEKNVRGIVINAFSDPFVVNRELFELIENLESSNVV